MLVYDNVKADRLGRRLPISTATAAVITNQQQRVRERFPHTPVATLKLLPTSYRNPDGTGRSAGRTLEARHRDWVAALPALRTRDGVPFDPPRSCPTPTGTPTPNGTRTPVCRSTCWPNSSITEASP